MKEAGIPLLSFIDYNKIEVRPTERSKLVDFVVQHFEQTHIDGHLAVKVNDSPDSYMLRYALLGLVPEKTEKGGGVSEVTEIIGDDGSKHKLQMLHGWWSAVCQEDMDADDASENEVGKKYIMVLQAWRRTVSGVCSEGFGGLLLCLC